MKMLVSTFLFSFYFSGFVIFLPPSFIFLIVVFFPNLEFQNLIVCV